MTVVAVYYKSVNCNPLTPITAICYGLDVQFVSTVDKILTEIACRAVHLRQQIFL